MDIRTLLLAAARGGGSFLPPEVDVAVVACIVGRTHNISLDTGDALPFENAKLDTEGTMWTIGDPTKIVIPTTGLWWVGSDITTLGTDYGGTGYSNANVSVEIVRNWDAVEPHLDDDIAFDRHANVLTTSAAGNSGPHPVLLDAGDELELLVTGPGSHLLIEANPSPATEDGDPANLTLEGTGVLSPNFYAILIGVV